MTPEGKVQAYLVKRVRELGGITRKVHWEGRVGAPDILVMLPEVVSRGPAGTIPAERFFVEVKAPGKKPRSSQLREHEELRRYGWRVEVVDSFSQVDEVLK